MKIHGKPGLALGLGSWLGMNLHGLHGLGLLQEHACETETKHFLYLL